MGYYKERKKSPYDDFWPFTGVLLQELPIKVSINPEHELDAFKGE